MAMPVYEYDDGLNRHFTHFLGQTVTVCVECGGASGRCFSGVLAAVYGDHIRLLNFVEPLPVRRRFRIAVRYRNVIGCRPFRPCFNGFGVITCIPVKKIVAFSHSTVPFLAPDLGAEQRRQPGRSPSLLSLLLFVLLVMLLMRMGRRAGEHEEPGHPLYLPDFLEWTSLM